MAKGVRDKVEGFYGEGVKLGGRSDVALRDIDPASLAGERALDRQRRDGGPPRPLGGHKSGLFGLDKVDYRNFTPAQMAAMAAERRFSDNLWCGVSAEDQLAIEASIKASLPQKKPPQRQRQGQEEDEALEIHRVSKRVKVEEKKAPPQLPALLDLTGNWDCLACTLVNQSGWLQCDACGAERVIVK